MNMITLEIELALERAGFRNPKFVPVLVAGLDHRLVSNDGRRKLQGIRRRAAASGQLPPRAVRRVQQWRARNAAPRIPRCCPNSARPPARLVALQELRETVRLFQCH